MRFRYSAHTRAGNVIRGALVAVSRDAAEEELVERGYLAVLLRQETQLAAALREFFARSRRPPTKHVVVFLRQLAVMVSAELPLIDALRLLVRQTEHPVLQPVVLDIVRDVESGSRLSDAFGAHPRIFSTFAVSLVRAGETSGSLAAVITHLADQAERDQELRSRIRGAMLYPSFIVGGLVVVSFIMMTFVVPRTLDVLRQTDAKLPLTTSILIAVSSFMAAWWWLLLVVVVLAFVTFRWALRYPDVRVRWDRTKLHIPVLGRIGQDLAIVRMTQSFEMLLRGGVGIIPSLEVIRDIVGNAAYRSLIEATTREVMDGNSITTRFRDSWLIPPMVTQLLAVGERSGELEQVLGKLSVHYQGVVERRIRNLITIIEPSVMILLGVAVGVTVAAIIMPMYNLVSSF